MGESGGSITAFRDTPDAVVLRFGDFQPADRPGFSARALPFDKNDDLVHLRQAYVRLTVDDQSEEFWMPCSSPENVADAGEAEAAKTVAGKGRRVELSFAPRVVPPGLFDPPPQGVAEARSGERARPRSTAAKSTSAERPCRRHVGSASSRQAAQIRESPGNAQRALGLRRSGVAGAVVPHVPVVDEPEQS